MLQINHNFKLIRELSGLSQQDFADILEATKDKIFNYEKGRAEPKGYVVDKIAQITGIDQADIAKKKLTAKDVDVQGLKLRINQQITAKAGVPPKGDLKDEKIAFLEYQVGFYQTQIADIQRRLDVSLAELKEQAIMNRAYLKTIYQGLVEHRSSMEKVPLKKVRSDMDTLLASLVDSI